MNISEKEARDVFGDFVGPREVGKVYRRGDDHEIYAVLDIAYGTDASRAAIGWNNGWSITVVGPDGRVRTHCTRWDPDRDVACPDICQCLHAYTSHHTAGCRSCDCPRSNAAQNGNERSGQSIGA